MKKYFLIALILLLPVSTHADTAVSGSINSDTTWSPVGGVYVIDTQVTVPVGVTLTIAPGTIVKTKFNGLGLNIFGHLVAQGDPANSIYLTSYFDDSLGGDTNGDATSTLPQPGTWGGVEFQAGSTGTLSHVSLRYSGGFDPSIPGRSSGIINLGGSVNIDSSILNQDGNFGLLQKDGTSTVSNSTISENGVGSYLQGGSGSFDSSSFLNNSEEGVRADAPTVTLTLTSNTFSGNHSPALIDAGVQFTHTGNTSSDTFRRLWHIGGSLTGNHIWNSDDLPIEPFVDIMPGATLTLEPGTIIKFENELEIQVDGTLNAQGTAAKPIYFTRFSDNSIGGDTDPGGPINNGTQPGFAIPFRAGSTGNLDHVVIHGGGAVEVAPSADAVLNLGGNVSITNSQISDTDKNSIYQSSGSLTLQKDEFARLGGTVLESLGGNFQIDHNSFHDDSLYLSNHSSSSVDMRNNWWGSSAGPDASRFTGPVLFDPWLTTDPLATSTATTTSAHIPVIIVPGISGSILVRDSDNFEIWPNVNDMTGPLDNYLDNLTLDNSGTAGITKIDPTEILKSVNLFGLGNTSVQQEFFDQLTTSGLVSNTDLFEFPYDWRLDISRVASDSSVDEVLSLKKKIDAVISATGSNKVNLVAHSMGGLVVKQYLKDYGGNAIANFIDMATPQYGAPDAFKILSYGDDLGFEPHGVSILNEGEVKKISQNMPAVYELLPSQTYFDSNDGQYKYYVWNGVNGNNELDFSKTKDYLKSAGRNATLVDRADAFHQAIDNLNPANYGVKTYNIVGCGTPTIGQFFILNQEDNGGKEYGISMISGDGTVPLKSALAIPAWQTYYVKGAQHATLPSAEGVKELVAALLTSTSTPNISRFSNLSTNQADCPALNGQLVSFHSPITLNIYDAQGRHVGPNANGDIEENITGVDYEVIDNNKFAYLPAGQDYKIVGDATGAGSFDARVETITNGNVTGLTYFNQVPIATTTVVTFATGSTTPKVISIDKNGDGTFEATTSPSSVVSGPAATDVVKPVTTVSLSGNQQKDGSYVSAVKVALKATDDSSGVLKIEYSLDGKSWLVYVEPFTVNTRGGTKIFYRATDMAGNVEVTKSQMVNIVQPGNSAKK